MFWITQQTSYQADMVRIEKLTTQCFSCPANPLILRVLNSAMTGRPTGNVVRDIRGNIPGYRVQQIKGDEMTEKFELFKDHAGKFRFHLKAANGEIIASSQGYNSKAGAENGIKSVRTNAPGAAVDDQTG
jgi:uncharacterized protein